MRSSRAGGQDLDAAPRLPEARRPPQEFAEWSKGGTARVVIANWAVERPGGGSVLTAEARVEPVGAQGRLGVAAVRPVVRAFQGLVGSDGINAAVRRASA